MSPFVVIMESEPGRPVIHVPAYASLVVARMAYQKKTSGGWDMPPLRKGRQESVDRYTQSRQIHTWFHTWDLAIRSKVYTQEEIEASMASARSMIADAARLMTDPHGYAKCIIQGRETNGEANWKVAECLLSRARMYHADGYYMSKEEMVITARGLEFLAAVRKQHPHLRVAMSR